MKLSTTEADLKKLFDEQEALLKKIKAQTQSLDSQKLADENESLKQSLEKAKSDNENLSRSVDELSKKLEDTKSALFAKAANEKLSAFRRVQDKIDEQYYKSDFSAFNRLEEYKNGCMNSIAATIKAVEDYAAGDYEDILKRLYSLKAEAEERFNNIHAYREREMSNMKKTNGNIGRSLQDEGLTETEKKTAMKHKSLEAFIGLNVLSKAGIFLFIIGIIMLGRYAYTHMSDVFKGGIIYSLGIVLLVGGEFFHKKEKNVFSTALVSGGIAVLYAAMATGYFSLHLYNAEAAFVICMIITAVALVISNQLKSEVVCCFTAVGGYLPIVISYMISFNSAAAQKSFLPASSIYFCVLAVIILFMTYNKKWYVAQFISYSLHMVALGGIGKCAWTVKSLGGYEYALPLAAAFSVASFIIYFMMPGIKIAKKESLSIFDLILLGINSVSGAISIGVTLSNCFRSFNNSTVAVGIMFVVMLLLYLLCTYRSLQAENGGSSAATTLLSVCSLIFAMLTIPYLFGWIYASVEWAVIGLALALFGMNKGQRISELAGFLCMALSVVVFWWSETLYANGQEYSTIGIISLFVIISSFWLYAVKGFGRKDSNKGFNNLYTIVELATALSSFLFLKMLYDALCTGSLINYSSDFTSHAVYILLGALCAYVIRLGILKNTATAIVSDIAGVILMPVCAYSLNLSSRWLWVYDYYGELADNKFFIVVNLILLISVNIIISLYFAKAVVSIINNLNLPAWIYTVAVSVSSLVLITTALMSQFEMEFSNALISGIYIAAACLLLVIGFKKRYTVVRSTGLALILCAFAKLCFIDTAKLESAWKIAAYFAFGAILMLISFVYQRFSKKLENENAYSTIEQTDKNE